MPEPNKRIIVDGVDFAQLVGFPKILGAATAGLQPSRLIIALLMVAALITFGRAWDAAVQPRIDPRGLTVGGLADEADLSAHQAALRHAMTQFAIRDLQGSASDAEVGLDAREVASKIEAGYRRLRAERSTPEAQAALDREYAQSLVEIERTRPHGPFEATARHVSACIDRMVQSVLSIDPKSLLAAAIDLLVGTPRALWEHQRWFLIAYGLLFVAVFAVGGGALSRMAACQFADQQRLTINQAIDFALERWGRLIWAQILPLLIAAVLCVAVALVGVLMLVPVLDVVGGLAYGVALVVGFGIAFLLLGYAVGFPLLVPAVACENISGADAMQRTYAYAASRPLHLIGYLLVALVGLALGLLLVSLMAVMMTNITAALIDAVTDNPAVTAAGGLELLDLVPQDRAVSQQQLHGIESGLAIGAAWHSRWAAGLIEFWQTLVVCLVGAYVLTFHFDAATRVYLLMRRACDGQELDEIWRPEHISGTLVPQPVATRTGSAAAAAPSPATGISSGTATANPERGEA